MIKRNAVSYGNQKQEREELHCFKLEITNLSITYFL
jgi:hypothetical protein